MKISIGKIAILKASKLYPLLSKSEIDEAAKNARHKYEQKKRFDTNYEKHPEFLEKYFSEELEIANLPKIYEELSADDVRTIYEKASSIPFSSTFKIGNFRTDDRHEFLRKKVCLEWAKKKYSSYSTEFLENTVAQVAQRENDQDFKEAFEKKLIEIESLSAERTKLGAKIKSKINFEDYDPLSILIGVEIFLITRHITPEMIGIDFKEIREKVDQSMSITMCESSYFTDDELIYNGSGEFTDAGDLFAEKFLLLQINSPMRCKTVASEIADLTAILKTLID